MKMHYFCKNNCFKVEYLSHIKSFIDSNKYFLKKGISSLYTHQQYLLELVFSDVIDFPSFAKLMSNKICLLIVFDFHDHSEIEHLFLCFIGHLDFFSEFHLCIFFAHFSISMCILLMCMNSFYYGCSSFKAMNRL